MSALMIFLAIVAGVTVLAVAGYWIYATLAGPAGGGEPVRIRHAAGQPWHGKDRARDSR